MIDKVVKNNLCANCETCISVCPVGAISYKRERGKNNFEIRVDKEKCKKCGLCLKVCPGLGVDQGVKKRSWHNETACIWHLMQVWQGFMPS